MTLENINFKEDELNKLISFINRWDPRKDGEISFDDLLKRASSELAKLLGCQNNTALVLITYLSHAAFRNHYNRAYGDAFPNLKKQRNPE
jgi:hypothetical protein